jgi:hypothetical protein
VRFNLAIQLHHAGYEPALHKAMSCNRCSKRKQKGNSVKRIILGVLLVLCICVLGALRVYVQNTLPASAAFADGTSDALTDGQLALLRKDIRSSKKQLIAANLNLTDAEAAKFWPVYDQYSVDFGKINETRAAIVKEYSDDFGTLTDQQADNLIHRWLGTDIAASELRQKYVPIMRSVLPAKKAATFFQLDRRISMMIDIQLTSQLPLAQGQE